MRLRWRRRRDGDAHARPSVDELLTTADRLCDDDRHREAIDRLTEANRAQRDPRLERRLVEIRSAAFRATAPDAARPSLPTVEDRFVGSLIPDIAAADLDTSTLRSAIEHHGSLIVRGLIPDDRVVQLRDDIERALAAFDRFEGEGDGQLDGEAAFDGWYRPFERDTVSNRQSKRKRGSVMTIESPATLFDLLETFRETGIDELVTEYFGEQPVLLGRKGTLRRVAHTGNTGGWHQDGAFMGRGIRSINIWIALTHCGDTAPGIDIVGKRLDHIVETGGGAFAAWATDPDAAARVADGVTVRPVFEPGDAVLFDHLNLHRTAIEPEMTHDRHAIETWLMSPSTYGDMTRPNEEGYTPRDQIPVVF